MFADSWGLFETGSTTYDGYDAFQTVNDPNATDADKALAVGGFAAGIVGPGGGYGTAGKTVNNAINKADEVGDAAKTAKGGTHVLKDKKTGEVVYCEHQTFSNRLKFCFLTRWSEF